jgi:DNA-binding transcriptional LysR family regulator
MTIKQLEFFIAVSDELSFRKAAERLYISQPPLTRHIKSLEDELGVILFTRNRKRIELTQVGKIFYKKSKDVLMKLEEAKDAVKLQQRDSVGVLKIDFIFFGMTKLTDLLINEFKKQYPNVELILNEISGTYNLKESLLNRETDIAFTYGMRQDARVKSLVIEHDPVVYLLPYQNRFANYKEIRLKDMKNENFILFPRYFDPLWYDVFLERCNNIGFSPKIVLHADSMWKRINAVSHGTGIAFVGSNFSNIGINGVEYIKPVEEEAVHLPITLSYRNDNDNIFIKSFLKILDKFINITYS